MDYGEKNILVLGAGSSGIGAAWVLAQLHANVVLNDYKPVEFEPSTRKRLEDAGVTIITGRQDNNLLDGCRSYNHFSGHCFIHSNRTRGFAS